MDLSIAGDLIAFRDRLKREVRGSEYIFIDWPDYSNTGDHIIWLGAKYILNELGLRCIREFSAWEARAQSMPQIDKDATVICSGGGNFGDIYENFQISREMTLARYPENKVIILPQTIYFGDENNRDRSREKFRRHDDVTLFVRDEASVRRGEGFTTHGAPVLAPDCGLFLSPIVQMIVNELRLPAPVYGRLVVERTDHEREGDMVAGSDGELRTDWCQDYDGYDPAIVAPLDRDLDAVLPKFESIFGHASPADRISLKRLIFGIRLLSLGRELVTDRLHAHVLACMMMITNVVYDNSYGKNRSFYDRWTKSCRISSFASVRHC